MANNRCAGCLFGEARPDLKPKAWGICRCHAPLPASASQHNLASQADAIPLWPTVGEWDWCGEWKARV